MFEHADGALGGKRGKERAAGDRARGALLGSATGVTAHGAPAPQKLPDDIAVELARRVNDRLHAAIRLHPTRLAAFATVPTSDARKGADALERCGTQLGFKGAMLHGLANGVFLDDRRFWPIYERA